MKIALAGCGPVGLRLGRRLLDAGHELAVYDREEERTRPLTERGVRRASDLEGLGRDAGMLVSALPDAAAVEAVFAGEQGAWAHASRGTIHVETSTIGPGAATAFAERARSRGVRWLDGPLTRGGAEGEAPEVVLLAGGDADDFDQARPILEQMVDRIVFCGAVGQGQVAKLANNLVAHALTVISGEALALGVRAGGSLELLRAALSAGTGQNRLLDELLPASLFRGDWRPGLRLALAERDLRLADELARERGVPLHAIDRLLDLYRRAGERGWSDLSSHAVVRLIEEAAGVTLRSPIFDALGESVGTEERERS